MSNSLSNPLRLYTVGTLLKDAAFRRAICQISTVCGGSSGGTISSVNGQTGPTVVLTASDINTNSTPSQTIQEALDGKNLQAVTDGVGNNITDNSIQVRGLNNFNPGIVQSISLLTASNIGGYIYYVSPTSQTVNINFQEDAGISINTLSGNVLTVNGDGATTGITASLTGRLQLQPAVNQDEAVTLSQLATGGITNSVLSGQPPTPTLLPNVYYTYIGEDNISYDLPPVAGNTGKRIGVISATTEIITLNSNAGGNDIIVSGVASSSIQIPAGQARILYNNSLGWIFLT